MAFPGKLLSLSIKTQIIWTMAIFSIISVILIYVIINLYIYEMKEENLNNYTEYYYSIQKDILQNIISFQNFFLFNYEDTLKILICQLVLILDISRYFARSDLRNIFKISFENLNFSNVSQKEIDEYIEKNDSELTIYYINNKNLFQNISQRDNIMKMTFKLSNAFKSFRIPYYGDNQLFDGVIVYLNSTKKIFSSNKALLYEFVKKEIGSDNLEEYYSNLRNNITNLLTMNLEKIIDEKSIYPELTLDKETLNLVYLYEKNKDIKLFSKYTPYMDYKKEYLHLIKIEDEKNEMFVTAKLIPGLIDNILLKMMEFSNITTILLSPEDDTVLNYMSCQALLIKLKFYMLSQNSQKNLSNFMDFIIENDEIFLNNNVTITQCLLGSDNLDLQEYYKQYLIQNKSSFYCLSSEYNSSFIQLSNDSFRNEYMVTRYTYPDYFLLERKQPRYLIVNYLNSYTFMNFYFPYLYVNDKSEFLLLNFYGITLSNWFLWIIIFIIIFIICLKISRDITGPLIKLKQAIEQLSFNDEKIFEYKDDDNINELFSMCKELVNKDEFKKSLKEKSFINENQLLEEDENKNYYSLGENDEKMSVIRKGVTRNLILNSQLFEKNRKMLNQESKTSFDKEIIVYKDFKFLLKSRPRNQSRKRPKTINRLINRNFDLDVPIKTYNKLKTKGDYNINSKIRDTFLRDSIFSNSTKKESKISFNESNLKLDKVNKNDNELNILLYELLFCLGKNMFKPKDRDKTYKMNKYVKSDKSIISNNNDFNSGYNDSIKNSRINEDNNNKFYNYPEPIFENNDTSDIIYEDIKSNSDIDRENKEKYLKEQYQINIKKNNLYYKYLKAKEDWNNKFIKQIRNVHDLELDSNAMVELDDEDNTNSLLPRKNLKKSDIQSSKYDRNTNLFKNIERKKDSSKLRASSLKKSIIKNKMKASIRKSISTPMNLFGKEITNPKQRKLGMRASVSANMQAPKNLKIVEKKKTRFNLDSKNN